MTSQYRRRKQAVNAFLIKNSKGEGGGGGRGKNNNGGRGGGGVGRQSKEGTQNSGKEGKRELRMFYCRRPLDPLQMV